MNKQQILILTGVLALLAANGQNTNADTGRNAGKFLAQAALSSSVKAEAKIQENKNGKESVNDVNLADISKMDYNNMIAKSLMSTGNNYRMKKVMEKARSGKEVTIAYIGGSITEGAGASNSNLNYAYQSYLYFKNTYGTGDKSNVNFINAGMGGTPSALGVIRYDRDVTKNGQVQPDIVFIEFAVNDYQEPTNGEAYESLVRNVLSAPNKPAVVLLFSVFQSKWNMQDKYQPIGSYYNLPMISIKNAVVPELEAGRLTDAEFFIDSYHPKDYGHKVMSDCISYYYNKVETEQLASSDSIIPVTTKIGKAYQGIKMIDSSVNDSKISIKPGSFTKTDTVWTFPMNWKHESGTKSFVMNLNCKNLMLVYKVNAQNTSGAVNIYVDGIFKMNINSYQSNGWNNPITVVLFNENSSAAHKVEIKMEDGSQNKFFTIMAFGYTQ